MSINARCVRLEMKSVPPSIIARWRGNIRDVAAAAAHVGLCCAAAGCVSEGAVHSLTRQAAFNMRRTIFS